MANLGKYELLKKLATGEMAEVFLAKLRWARGLEKTVVVKRILPDLAGDPAFVEQFFSEAQLAAQLSHPNLAQITEFGESDGVYFLAMEYIQGPNLRALMTAARADGGIPFAHSARIAAFCCEALAYAHEMKDAATGRALNLVHRDVTPENILVSRAGAVKLVDFSIARAATQAHQTRTGQVKGKVAYMSPEHLRAEPVDRRADVYSLGMVLYELVAGKKPWDAATDILLAHAARYEEMIPLRTRRPDAPASLERIIHRALERNRAHRYPDCRAMHAELEEYLVSSQQSVSALQLAQLVERYGQAPAKAAAGAPPAPPAKPPAKSSKPAKPGKPKKEPPPPPRELTSASVAQARLQELLRGKTAQDAPAPEVTKLQEATAPALPPPPPAEALAPPEAGRRPARQEGDTLRWDIVEEHLDEADFLYGLWEAALRSPDYALEEIAGGPERRLLAHLDGLVLGGPHVAGKLLVPALASKEPGVVFAAAYALLDGQRPADLDALLGAMDKAEQAQRASIRRAMAVVPRVSVGQQLAAAIVQATSLQVDLLEVLGQLRVNPGLLLDPFTDTGKSSAEALAIRLAQVFPEHLDPSAIERAFSSPVPEVCSAAFETGLVAGTRDAFAACESAVAARTPGFGTAALLLGLSGDEASGEALLAALADKEYRRDVVFALGFSGRISAADQLLEAMKDEEVAPLAAEAFSAITGLRVEKAFAVPPEVWNPDEPREELMEEIGADLPSPVPEEIARWWKAARPKLDPAQRWLRGQPWSAAALLQELEHGPARRREALALDLAIRSRGEVQLAWNGLTARQRQELRDARNVQRRLHAEAYRELGPGKPMRAPPGPAPLVPRVAVHRTAPAPPKALAVTGIGMVTSLGYGAAPVCAALRANLARPGPLEYTAVDSEDASASAVMGHPLEGFEGYQGLALHARMASAAIEDLLESLAPPGGGGPAALDALVLLCLTAPARADEGELLDEMVMEELPGLVAAALPVPPVDAAALLRGHAAGLQALSAAADLLRSHRAERLLVVATDSLVDADALAWLEARELLKTPENPTGVAPGQAAVAMLLETQAAARSRGAEVLGFIEAVAMGARKEGQPPGRALANAVLRAWPADAPAGDLYGDLNGETRRAHEWGSAQVHLAPRRPLDGCSLQLPALGLGDTGTASGLVAVALALQDFARGWARGERSIVWSQSDSGEVAAALVTAPAAPDGAQGRS